MANSRSEEDIAAAIRVLAETLPRVEDAKSKVETLNRRLAYLSSEIERVEDTPYAEVVKSSASWNRAERAALVAAIAALEYVSAIRRLRSELRYVRRGPFVVGESCRPGAAVKNDRMQAKDVGEERVLSFIATQRLTPWPTVGGDPPSCGRWVFMHELAAEMPSVPHRVLVAKLRSLRRRRLINACLCGCRGDLELTASGEYVIGGGVEP